MIWSEYIKFHVGIWTQREHTKWSFQFFSFSLRSSNCSIYHPREVFSASKTLLECQSNSFAFTLCCEWQQQSENRREERNMNKLKSNIVFEGLSKINFRFLMSLYRTTQHKSRISLIVQSRTLFFIQPVLKSI